jgi:DNA polymerase-1
VTKEQRNGYGKMLNFAILYGQGAAGLSRTLGISESEAKRRIAAYFSSYPQVQQWKQIVEQQAMESHEVRTLYGRRRTLPDVGSCDTSRRRPALRQAVNTVIQGTAADINKFALVCLYNSLPETCRLLVTVHDSVLIEVPEDDVETIAKLVKNVMQTPPPKFSVPLVVDVQYGRTWADCKKGTGNTGVK